MKPPNSTLNRGTSTLSRAKAGNLKRSNMKRKPVKWKTHTHHPWKNMLATIYSRARGRCERCKRRISQDEATPSNVHHVLPRSAGGSDDPTNTTFICSSMQFYGRTDNSCHTWAHSHPIEARREGWNK